MFTVIDVRKQLGLSVGGVSDRQLSTDWCLEAIALEAGCHCMVRALFIILGWSRVPHPGHSGVLQGVECEKASFGGLQLLGGQGEEVGMVSPLFRTEDGSG